MHLPPGGAHQLDPTERVDPGRAEKGRAHTHDTAGLGVAARETPGAPRRRLPAHVGPEVEPRAERQRPVAGGLGALALRWQWACHIGDRDAGAHPVMATRWQRVRDGLGAAPSHVSQGTLGNLWMRLMAHTLAQTLRERPVAWAAQTGGVGARQRARDKGLAWSARVCRSSLAISCQLPRRLFRRL